VALTKRNYFEFGTRCLHQAILDSSGMCYGLRKTIRAWYCGTLLYCRNHQFNMNSEFNRTSGNGTYFRYGTYH